MLCASGCRGGGLTKDTTKAETNFSGRQTCRHSIDQRWYFRCRPQWSYQDTVAIFGVNYYRMPGESPKDGCFEVMDAAVCLTPRPKQEISPCDIATDGASNRYCETSNAVVHACRISIMVSCISRFTSQMHRVYLIFRCNTV